ncbi:MAG TPA: 2-amino-4-hydroxy-6-hydroxymethyldihydropteridine diphosphokinase [Actinomycetales bacterium]|nr:2-amino-4-hydroxy-6-hydroxymethyldihydropteridine diphosphokinase [Actinomycetales bacterium]
MTSPVRPADLDAVPAQPVPVVLALGSNLGDSAATLTSAVAVLDDVDSLTVDRVSPVVQTAPVGGPDQGDYLNAVVLAVTTLSPHQLLAAVHVVEAAHGRTRETRWGARTLDVDVIAYGELVCAGERLEVPHPRAHERAFVLVPWAAVDPDAVLPGPHGGRVNDLAAAAPDAVGVRPTAVQIR